MRIFLILSCVLVSCSFQAFADSDALTVQRILDRYTETFGGRRAVEALSSLSVDGIQIQGGKTYDFLMRKKRPNLIRYRLSQGDSAIVCGYNGKSGWQSIETASEVNTEDLSADQLSVLREEAEFDSPLFRHLEKSWNAITLVGDETIGGARTIVLEVTEFGKPFARYYLESRSGLLLKRVRLNSDGSFGLETLYRKYREVDGCQFAFEIENRLGDQQLSLVQIKEIAVNPGLLNFYFEKPRS